MTRWCRALKPAVALSIILWVTACAPASHGNPNVLLRESGVGLQAYDLNRTISGKVTSRWRYRCRPSDTATGMVVELRPFYDPHYSGPGSSYSVNSPISRRSYAAGQTSMSLEHTKIIFISVVAASYAPIDFKCRWRVLITLRPLSESRR